MRRPAGFSLLLLAATSAFALAQEGPARRAEFAKLKPDDQRLIRDWLNHNCGAGEQERVRVSIARLGAALEPVFWEAYRAGPFDEDVRALRAGLARTYAQRQEALKAKGEALFGKEETARLLAVTEADFAARELQLNAERFKSQALNGLGPVGTEKSEAELARLAETKDHPDQVCAREALRAIRARRNR